MAGHQTTKADYAREIAKLLAVMPVERAAQVYDFARFLQSEQTFELTPTSAEEDDWLNDDLPRIAAEDVVWDAAYHRDRKALRAMADRAVKEHESGDTSPLFDEQGHLIKP